MPIRQIIVENSMVLKRNFTIFLLCSELSNKRVAHPTSTLQLFDTIILGKNIRENI